MEYCVASPSTSAVIFCNHFLNQLVHATDRCTVRPESDAEWGRRTASPRWEWPPPSGGEVRVLHGVEAVDGGEQRGVAQGQAVGVSHVTQRVSVHLNEHTFETWKRHRDDDSAVIWLLDSFGTDPQKETDYRFFLPLFLTAQVEVVFWHFVTC